MKKQIFISYRRDGGDVMAKMLNDRLAEMGYDVFYDIESLKAGAFDVKLYEEIEGCTDFILILPKNGLNNCVYDGDWVRCELSHALKHKKNIIPVFLRDFAFPMNMPDDINAVRHIQGVDFTTMEYFESRVDKIVGMLRSKPSYTTIRPNRGPNINKITAYGTNGTSTTPSNKVERHNTINIEEYENVCFFIDIDLDRLNMPSYTLVIVDDVGMPVYDYTALYSTNGDERNMTITWKIKEKGYPLVAPGKYRATICIENSEQYAIGIEVILRTKESTDNSNLLKRIFPAKHTSSVEAHLSYPRGGRLALFYGIFMLFFQYISLPAISYGEDSLIAVIIISIIVGAVLFIKLLRYTKKYITGRVITSIILLLPGITYIYCIYLIYKRRECKTICKKHNDILNKISSITHG